MKLNVDCLSSKCYLFPRNKGRPEISRLIGQEFSQVVLLESLGDLSDKNIDQNHQNQVCPLLLFIQIS
jgi:hypothetical protein